MQSIHFAIVVDASAKIKVFILRMEYLQKICPSAKTISWKMSKKWLETYKNDPEIKTFEFEHFTDNWW